MITPYSKFKSVTNVAAPLLMNELESNWKSFMDWGLLNVGGYHNVVKSDTGPYGGDFSALKMVPNSEFGDGYEWEGIRKDWVYEKFDIPYASGSAFMSLQNFVGDFTCTGNFTVNVGDTVTFTDIQCICKAVNTDGFTHTLSLVSNNEVLPYANPMQYTIAKGTYRPILYINGNPINESHYYINYPMGTVIFNTPVDIINTVQADYSYRTIQVYKADDVPWWQEIQYNSLRSDSIQFAQNSGQGDWMVGGEHRLQLPIIVVEATQRGDGRPYEMGNEALWATQDMTIVAITEDRYMRNNIVDIIRYQLNKEIWLYNSSAIAQDDAFPLDFRGAKVNNNVYTTFVDSDLYRWQRCFISRAHIYEMSPVHPELFFGGIRITCEAVLGVQS